MSADLRAQTRNTELSAKKASQIRLPELFSSTKKASYPIQSFERLNVAFYKESDTEQQAHRSGFDLVCPGRGGTDLDRRRLFDQWATPVPDNTPSISCPPLVAICPECPAERLHICRMARIVKVVELPIAKVRDTFWITLQSPRTRLLSLLSHPEVRTDLQTNEARSLR